MKKIFLTLFIFNIGVECMEKWEVYVNMVHDGVEGDIVAKVESNADDVKLINYEAEERNQVILSEEEDSLEIVVSSANNATIGIYSSEDLNNSLLSFVLKKTGNHMPAKAEFSNIGYGLRAIFYRPSMGGGDNFVLAIGRKESDVSVSAVQQALTHQLSYLQMYFPVISAVGQ